MYLYDQLLWGLDRRWLLSPSDGVLTYYNTRRDFYGSDRTIFEYFPYGHPDKEDNSELADVVFWSLHYGGILCGVLLLLGVAPKLSLLGIYINIVSFNHIGDLPMDSQDDHLRVMAFWFFFLPLNHVTIYDTFHKNGKEPSDDNTATWSIWPYRLVQFQCIYFYLGASWGKLATNKSWIEGLEIWRALHGHIFCVGPWQPDFLLNTLLPLKLLTWVSLFIETICVVTVWPLRTRKITVWVMVLFHVGIDITMNMHIFEWVCILAWLFFLAEPESMTTSIESTTESTSSPSTPPSFYYRRWITNPIIAFLVLGAWAQSNNMNLWLRHAPPQLLPILETYVEFSREVEYYLRPVMNNLGFYQEKWRTFPGNDRDTSGTAYRWFASIQYTEEDIGRSENTVSDDYEVHTMVWASPDWLSMPWWVQKRHQRNMLFFENLGGEFAIYKSLCRRLYDDYRHGIDAQSIIPGGIVYTTASADSTGNVSTETKEKEEKKLNIISITLELQTSTGPLYPPESLGPWDVPAIQKDMITYDRTTKYIFIPPPPDEESTKHPSMVAGQTVDPSSKISNADTTVWDGIRETASEL
jgi:hypothetical protein